MQPRLWINIVQEDFKTILYVELELLINGNSIYKSYIPIDYLNKLNNKATKDIIS